jgi:glycosyltransferase involved in cell wall biosynthesis
VLTQSGYGVHARQILRWLKEQEELGKLALTLQIMPWGDTSWYVDPQAKNGLIGYAMSRTGELTPPYDVAIQLQLPNEWDSRLGKYNVGVTAGIETTKCHPEWTAACAVMNKVVVPSEHSKKSLGVPDIFNNITVVPESYIDEIDLLDGKEFPQIDLPINNTDFAVLMNGQLTGGTAASDRKNSFSALKWMCELFHDDPKFVIVFKTNMARNSKIDRMVTGNLLKQMLSQVRRGGSPRVILVHGDLDDESCAKLYRHPAIKALVTTTRGEGFGLPILEAAASGLPVIATDWSAHTEYLQDKYTSLKSSLVDVHSSRIDNRLFVKGSQWAEVSEIDFKNKMKKFRFDHSKQISMAVSLKKSLKDTHSWEAISKKYDVLFEGIM